MAVLSPVESSLYIVQNADHVHINEKGIHSLSEKAIEGKTFNISSWSAQELTPSIADERAVNWVFVTDLLNFSFWSPGNVHYAVSYNGKIYTGYWALCAAVNRSVQDGIDILNPHIYKDISEEALRNIFRSCNSADIPLFQERLQVLHQAGQTLCKHFDGSFVNIVKLCNKSAFKLIELVCEHFPSFRDYSQYKTKQVSFLKRAQILVGDLWSCFQGLGLGCFDDINEITAFADYRVPQVLVYFGAIEYDEFLEKHIREGRMIDSGTDLENEIRGATIYAVQLIVQRLRNQSIKCNAILVDHYLWNYRRDHADLIDEVIPMHKTRCIYY